jgi:hypothetical protein
MFGFYPQRFSVALEDRFLDNPIASQSRTTSGRLDTVYWGSPTGLALALVCKGYPRAAAHNDYHALREAVSRMSQGYAFRYYPDAGVSSQFDPDTNRLGWQLLKLDAEDFGWDVPPLQGNFYKYWEKRLRCWESV